MRTLFAYLLLVSSAFAQMGANLVPIDQATDRAFVSGSWQDKATWADGTVPENAEKIYIPPGIQVTNNGTTADVQWIRVAGELKGCDHCDTRLNVHTLYIDMGGRLNYGSVGMPCAGLSVIEWLPGPFLPGDWQKLSRGLLCAGECTISGNEKTEWDLIDGELAVGATSLNLIKVPFGWKVGDHIIVAGTDSIVGDNDKDHRYQSEELIISAIKGRTISWTKPLVYRHWLWRSDLAYHCANITRNVIIRSRDPSTIDNRGHCMLMSTATDVRYFTVLNCGRTDKSRDVTDPRLDAYGEFVSGSDANTRARYSWHWHRASPVKLANGTLVFGVGPPAVAKGFVIDGSPGLGIVNHASNCQLDGGIVLRCFGAGFFTEEGQERGHMRRCLACLNRGQGDTIKSSDGDHGDDKIGDWGRDGSGFWLQGGMVEVSDCVSFDNSGRGFALFNQPLNSYPRYNGAPVAPWIQFPIVADPSLLSVEYDTTKPVPSSGVPQLVFDRNTAYGTKIGLQGWSPQFHDGLPPSIRGNITNFKTYARGAMMHFEYMTQFNVRNSLIHGDSLFRNQFSPTTNPNTPMVMGSPDIAVSGYDIVGCFRRDGNNWPKPRPIYFVGSATLKTISVDGTYPIVNADTGAVIR